MKTTTGQTFTLTLDAVDRMIRESARQLTAMQKIREGLLELHGPARTTHNEGKGNGHTPSLLASYQTIREVYEKFPMMSPTWVAERTGFPRTRVYMARLYWRSKGIEVGPPIRPRRKRTGMTEKGRRTRAVVKALRREHPNETLQWLADRVNRSTARVSQILAE